MAEGEFKSIVISMLLFGLFVISLINFGILIGLHNNAQHNIGDEPSIKKYKENLEESLKKGKKDSELTEDVVSSSPITLSVGTVFFEAMGGIWKTIKEVPTTIFNLTFGLLAQKLFGDESYGIILGVIATILTLTIILAVWRLIARGD